MFETKKDELHLWELDKQKTYVLLEENIRDELFYGATPVDLNEFYRYPSQFRRQKKGTAPIRLDVLLKLSELSNVPMSDVERRIYILTGSGGSEKRSIRYPKFPWRLNPTLVRIISHFIRRVTRKAIPTVYVSRSVFLGKLFIKNLEKYFGKITPSLYVELHKSKYCRLCLETYSIKYRSKTCKRCGGMIGLSKGFRVLVPAIVKDAVMTFIAKYEGMPKESIYLKFREEQPYLFKVCKENNLVCLQTLCDDVFTSSGTTWKGIRFNVGKKRVQLINEMIELMKVFDITSKPNPENEPWRIFINDGNSLKNFRDEVGFSDPVDREILGKVQSIRANVIKEPYCPLCSSLLFPNPAGKKSHKCRRCGFEVDVKMQKMWF